jgi:hypothetical protein
MQTYSPDSPPPSKRQLTEEEQAFVERLRVKKPVATEPTQSSRLTPEQEAFIERLRVKKAPEDKNLKDHALDIAEGTGRGLARAGTKVGSWVLRAGEQVNPTGEKYTEEELAEMPEWQRAARRGLNKPKSRESIQHELEEEIAPTYFAKRAEGFGALPEEFLAEEAPQILTDAAITLGNPGAMFSLFLSRRAGGAVTDVLKNQGFSEQDSELGGLGIELLVATLAPTNVKDVAQKLYKRASSHIKDLEPIAPQIVSSVAQKGERLLTSPLIDLEVKAKLKPFVEEFKKVFSEHKIFKQATAQELMAQKIFKQATAQELMAQNTLLDKTLGKPQRKVELLVDALAPDKVKDVAQKLHKRASSRIKDFEPIAPQIVGSVAQKAKLKPNASAPYKIFRQATAQELMAQNSFVNNAIGKALFDRSLSKSQRKAAAGVLSEFAHDINDALYKVTGSGAADFVKYQKAADAAYAGVAQNPYLNKSLTNALKRLSKSPGSSSSSLYLAHHLGLLTPLAKGAAGAATSASIINAPKALLKRVASSPELRAHYLKAMAYKAAYDIERSAQEIQKIQEKLDEEES